jgi:hypothetical protein
MKKCIAITAAALLAAAPAASAEIFEPGPAATLRKDRGV